MRWTSLLLAVTVVACANTETISTEAAPLTSTQIETTTTVAVSATAPATTQTIVAGRLIEISVIGGEVVGGGKLAVALGEKVTIRVTADVTDEIHLHGYDIALGVTPVATAEIVFTADIPGVFEIEFEESGLALAEIEVS